MTYCLNPACQQPQNPGDAKFCQNCGLRLLLADRYRALELIGQGGFGRTYLAVDEQEPDKTYCVIKQVLPRWRDPRQAARSFEQEVARLAQLGHHPQIPQLLDHLQREDGQYLIQEFIDGQNLADALEREGAFSEVQIRQLLNDLLPVLRFIHGHQIIHRDIKPENIIRPAGENALVLVDFGASKYATGTTLARTGTVIGSAGYVAPEQAIGRAEYASDLYSLGVTCVHLLTAMHPFDLYSISEDAWVWRQYLNEPIADDLGRVLDKLLQRATSQRYRTATAVLQDLNATPSSLRQVTRRVPVIAGQPQSPELASVAESPKLLAPVDANAPWFCRQVLTGHTGTIDTIAISPDGFILASGSNDRTVKLWDLETGHLIHTFASKSLWFNAGPRDRVSAVCFSPDGQTLITASDDGTIKLWDLSTKKIIHTLTEHDWGVAAIAVSANGHTLVSGGTDGTINLWNLETGDLTAALSKHRDRVGALVISPDGQTLISGSDDKTIRLWDLSSDRLVNTLSGHSDRVTALALSLDWRTLISGSGDKTLKFWDLGRGEQVRTVAAHADLIHGLAISPDGDLLASGSEDSRIKIWNLIEGKRICTLRHSWGVTAIAFAPDGQTLVSSSADETIKIWQRNE